MTTATLPPRPTKDAQRLARTASDRLTQNLRNVATDDVEVTFERQQVSVTLPREALALLRDILEAMAKGQPVSIVPLAAELTTQFAADLLGCSRPHLIKLLENGTLPFTKVGRHRRVRYDDVTKYAEATRRDQRTLLAEMMADDEDSGLYDSPS